MRDMKADSRPKRHGWAPGDYMATCRECDCRFIGDKRASACADCAYEDWAPSHRHGKTGGLYRLLDFTVMIESTWRPGVVYEAQDGTLIVRDVDEFNDGRFARIDRD